MYSLGSVEGFVAIQSYSAVSIRSSILEFTSSKMRSLAWRFALLNFEVAVRRMGEVEEGEWSFIAGVCIRVVGI